MHKRRGRIVTFFFTIVLPVTHGVGMAQESSPDGDGARFLGAQNCARCHRDGPTQFDIDAGVAGFISLNEANIWAQNDKHAIAFKLIDFESTPTEDRSESQRLSQQICDRLGIDDLSNAQQCLSCHANWVQGHPRPPTYKNGVTCESCHGASSRWQEKHAEPTWRKMSPEEKFSKYNFVNVRDPVHRAEQCYSCHIGSSDQGKIVNHEMFAAGHPPLPGIEIESFARQMPPHWQYLNEKDEFKFRPEYVAANFPHVNDQAGNEMYRTRAVVLGGVTAMREAIELFVDQSAGSEQQPELAVYDCFACHHDLKMPSWRQQRGFVGTPGRPRMRPWPTALVRLGIFHAFSNKAGFEQHDDVFQQRLNAVHQALDARPFGDRAAIRKAGLTLVEHLNELSEELETKSYDQAAAHRLFRYLCREGAQQLHDYDSARQIGWAARSMYAAFDPKPDNSNQIEAIIDDLTQLLRLDLPAGQNRSISSELPEALETLANYEPEPFRQSMERLGKLVK